MNVEQAKELHSSVLWEELCKEIDNRIKFEEGKLRSCLPEQLKYIQTKILALEELKRIPTDLIDREA